MVFFNNCRRMLSLQVVPPWVGIHCVLSLWAQSYPTLCDPVDCSLPGSSVHGIFQAIILEWVAISYSSWSSWLRNQTCIILCLLFCQAGSLPLALPCGCGHIYDKTCIHHYSITYTIFTALKVLPLTNPFQQLSFHCHHSFTFCKMTYTWNYTVYSLFRLTYFTLCL